ncbi:hypothetical protein [Microbacterium paludicola]|uniref:hypothetical protein n=1 Tax=Microbacterium paludicola TaxID=300019 RepID=UPI00090C808F|nr:hypothetical protein [Microbacterium paludicola]APF34909.1 hypothetical protein BO218_12530 [Microbacterium paludicola]
MVDESDGLEAASDGQLRIAITVAGRIGETLARAHEDAARRERDADKLEQRGIGKEAVSAKTAADVSQSKPATAAVKAQQTRSAKARPNRSRSPKIQRTELWR